MAAAAASLPPAASCLGLAQPRAQLTCRRALAPPLQSTMFNALCENGKAQAANFPFCTIEPNVGIVAVPDERLSILRCVVLGCIVLSAPHVPVPGRIHSMRPHDLHGCRGTACRAAAAQPPRPPRLQRHLWQREADPHQRGVCGALRSARGWAALPCRCRPAPPATCRAAPPPHHPAAARRPQDIAGLVKGASKGEGLGNQFLANIRECDSIVQVGGWAVGGLAGLAGLAATTDGGMGGWQGWLRATTEGGSEGRG